MTDTFWNDVSLLVTGGAVDAGTTFVDESDDARTVTPSGNAQTDTAITLQGSNTILLDGSGDYLSVPHNSTFNFGSGDFTLDVFVQPSSIAASRDILAKDDSGGSGRGWLIIMDTTQTRFTLFIGGVSTSITGPALVVGVGAHLRVCRSGTTVRLFKDGVFANKATSVGTIDSNTVPTLIGNRYLAGSPSTSYFPGSIAEVRVTNAARNTTDSNFTAPTTKWPRTVSGVAAAAGAGTAQGTGAARAATVGAAAGIVAVASVGRSFGAAAGSAAGTSSAAATTPTAAPAVGLAAGTSSADAPSSATGIIRATKAAASGTSTAVATSDAAIPAFGTSTGTSTAVASGSRVFSGAGQAAGVGDAQGHSVGYNIAVGEASGDSSAAAIAAALVPASGVADVVGDGNGIGVAVFKAAGVAAADSSVAGVGNVNGSGVGAVGVVGGAVGRSSITSAAGGSSTASSSGSAVATGLALVVGTSSATVSATGVIAGRSVARGLAVAAGLAAANGERVGDFPPLSRVIEVSARSKAVQVPAHGISGRTVVAPSRDKIIVVSSLDRLLEVA